MNVPASVPVAGIRANLTIRASWLAYGIIALLPLLLLAPWIDNQFNRDEGTYAAMAFGIGKGLVPYRDLFDHKPPLIYLTYWLIALVDDGVLGPRIVACAVLGATGVIVVHVSRALGYSRIASWAAGFALALSVSNQALEIGANTEVWLLPFVSAALLLVASAKHRSPSVIVLAGALSAIAVLFKTSAVFPAIALGAWLLLADRQPRLAALFCAGFVAPIACCAAVFIALGAFDDFWYANVTYNQLYANATSVPDRLRNVASFQVDVLARGPLTWLLAASGVAVCLINRSRSSCLVLAWTAAAYASVKFTGRDFGHYYVQLLPAAALLVAPLVDFGSEQRLGRGVVAAAAGGAAILGILQANVYASDVAQELGSVADRPAMSRIHRCETATPAIGAWLRANTSAGDRFYNLGRDSSMFLYAGKAPPTRFFYDRPFALDPSVAPQVAAALSSSPPRYIVDTMKFCERLAPPPQIASLIAERYVFVTTVETADIYELRVAR